MQGKAYVFSTKRFFPHFQLTQFLETDCEMLVSDRRIYSLNVEANVIYFGGGFVKDKVYLGRPLAEIVK